MKTTLVFYEEPAAHRDVDRWAEERSIDLSTCKHPHPYAGRAYKIDLPTEMIEIIPIASARLWSGRCPDKVVVVGSLTCQDADTLKHILCCTA